ncbi:MAG TPA: LysM peptidoglycan-binding domain-containing protein [Frankiaceae bacterium]|nr:LysM peptidoglycan-binding domain-containing protein [Frankiaceae bacterium]
MTAMTFDTPLRPSSSPSTERSPERLRLTRRGRLLLLLTFATLLLVAFSLGRTSADAGSSPAVPRPVTVVQPGETLWAIARRVAPGTDPRATIARLTELNDLGARPIVAGQRLVLPR